MDADGRGIEVMREQQVQRDDVDADQQAARLRAHDELGRARARRTAAREVLASHYGGLELNSPNDIVVRSDGRVLHRPHLRPMARHRHRATAATGLPGRLPARRTAHPELVADDFGEPNGLCFSPDESLLYVNDTHSR